MTMARRVRRTTSCGASSGRSRDDIVWDLGCNDGRYSRIASDGADVVVAIDSDRHVVDALYRALRDDADRKVLPLVVDLGDPSPAIGWRNAERATLLDRGSPELVLCLALVHHLSISGNVPLREVVRWLRALDSEVVIEFPDRGDPMVQRLLGAKRDEAHPDYTRTSFEGAARLELQDRRVARARVWDADAVPRSSGLTAPLSRTSPRTTSVTTKWGRLFASS